MSIKEVFENAKSKVKETYEKVKEKCGQAKIKAVNFANEHPEVVLTAVLGVTLAGASLIAGATQNRDSDDEYASIDDGHTKSEPDTAALEAKKQAENEAYRILWEHEYKENWDKVNDFVDTLELKRGEMYVIEDQRDYITEGNPLRPVVSHLVDNDGVYPPEEDEDQ